jgi:arylsulfatase A-like enzyme
VRTVSDAESDRDRERPNVVVFFTDQQRWDSVGAYGSPMALTPNLDRMAERGTLLEQAFTPQPVCAPARGCMQTGQFATEHGVWRNAETLAPGVGPTLAGLFDEHGYDTGYVGKWHLASTGVDPVPEEHRAGYDHWRVADALEHTSHPYEGLVYDGDGDAVEFDGYRVDALTDMAIDFVEEDRDDPFFLFCSQLEPHHQNDMETYVAPDGYAERYSDPWVPEDLRGVPGDWHSELPDYYGIVRRLDECFGRLLGALEEQGIREETVVLFTSDHGSHFRTRNGEYKRSCHESSIRVPAAISGPGFDTGADVDDLVSLLDVPPTLLDAAGIEPPESMRGSSLRPLARGESSADWREEVFVQISEASVGRAIRTDRWKYCAYDPDAEGGADPTGEEYVDRYLYDLRADPHERTNLVGRADHEEILDDMRERLRERIAAVEGADAADVRAADHQA